MYYSFLEYSGSDERRYCSPGVDIPMCSIMRSKYGSYKEYHTSKDNLSFISPKGFQGSLNIYKKVIEILETNYFYKIKTICEPQLGKRGLYPTLSHVTEKVHPAKKLTNILTYCNGKNSIFDICKLTKLNLKEVLDQMKIVYEKNLIIAKNPILGFLSEPNFLFLF